MNYPAASCGESNPLRLKNFSQEKMDEGRISGRAVGLWRVTVVNKKEGLLIDCGDTLNNAGSNGTLDIKLQGAGQGTFFRIAEGKDGLGFYIQVNGYHVRISQALAREILRRSMGQ
jgi:hypothetical protein